MRRQYDAAQTPYQRVLADQHVDEHVKATLTEHDERLHPVQVKLAMEELQTKLYGHAVSVGREASVVTQRTDERKI
ncbi:MAG: hypothetical protein U0821_20625 [Chloroflexota bacterium]